MKVEVKVPAMGESITQATVGTILKSSGSIVKMDDELLELETDKVNQVIYAPQGGLLNLTVASDAVVNIGDVIGSVDTDMKEQGPIVTTPIKEEAQKSQISEQQSQKPKEIVHLQKPDNLTLPTEGARQTKEEFISDIKSGDNKPCESSGIKNESEKEAAEELSKSSPPINSRETRTKMSKIRQTIATRLVQAQQTTAMLTTFNEIDMSQVMTLREKYKDSFSAEHGVKLGFMSFFVKAAVAALQAFPEFNSYIEKDEIVHREYYDIGVAVGTDKGVFVPILRNCDTCSFPDIERLIESFAKKAREGSLLFEDLQGGGFTITNGGVYGSLLSTPILIPPQGGILGMHKIEKRPIVINDQIVIRPMMYLALSYDHRIVDGRGAVSFLVHIKNCLEDPSRLLLEI